MILGSFGFGAAIQRGVVQRPQQPSVAPPLPPPTPVHRGFWRHPTGPRPLTPREIAEIQANPSQRTYGPRPLTPQEIADIQRNPQTRTGAGHWVALPPPPPPPPPPSLAPPPPPPPPPTWQQQWSALRRLAAERAANQGPGHFTDGFGRPVRRGRMPARMPVRRPAPQPRYLFPRSAEPTVIYMQPLPGCTVSPNPIPPCSGTLTWVDSRTVCCR